MSEALFYSSSGIWVIKMVDCEMVDGRWLMIISFFSLSIDYFDGINCGGLRGEEIISSTIS